MSKKKLIGQVKTLSRLFNLTRTKAVFKFIEKNDFKRDDNSDYIVFPKVSSLAPEIKTYNIQYAKALEIALDVLKKRFDFSINGLIDFRSRTEDRKTKKIFDLLSKDQPGDFIVLRIQRGEDHQSSFFENHRNLKKDEFFLRIFEIILLFILKERNTYLNGVDSGGEEIIEKDFNTPTKKVISFCYDHRTNDGYKLTTFKETDSEEDYGSPTGFYKKT